MTSTLELATGVVILPQRQTVLVAKQAAQVDLLSGGRLRLGVGLGWNRVEYEALGEDFTSRGKRSEEQIDLLRTLWTQRSVTFDGRFHQVAGAGIAPLPVQRPIPVWIGASSAEVTFRRAGRLADGWFAQVPSGIGFRGTDCLARRPPTGGRRAGQVGRGGASHMSINTIGAGFETVEQHLAALAEVAPQSVV